MLTDTHVHLDFPDYAEDLEAVLERATAAGVTRLIGIGTSVASSRRAVALAEKYPQVWAAIGIHPNAATESELGDLAALRELAAHPRVAAIGECGLDFFRSGTETHGRQEEVFRAQLELSIEVGLNVVIHQRASWKDTLRVLREYTGRVRSVFHCFGETFARAEELFALGHLVSFTGLVTFKNAAAAQESAARTPAGKFMVETDCPFLAPVPYRGKRCEPAYVREVAEQVATLRGLSLAELAEETERTAAGFFRLS